MPNILHGVSFPSDWNALQCQLYLFHFGNQFAADPFWRPAGMLDSSPSERPYVGGGRFEHAQAIAKLIWPGFEWNEWALTAVDTFCNNQHTAIAGCGGSGKSTSAAIYALLFWMCAPQDSAVLIASTTISASKKRIWKNASGFYSDLARMAGSMDSVMLGSPTPRIIPLIPKPGGGRMNDEAHGLHVVAVAGGEVEKGINRLKGFHPRRILFVGDEMDSIGQAAIDVWANWQIGTTEFQTISLGNDPSLFNPLGDLMQPDVGKPITLEHKEWISTKGIKCLRFDGYDSPNVKDPGKWKGLIGKRDIDKITKQYGENSPQVWIMIRGLHPPEGADNTVLSESMFIRFNCRDSVIWRTGFTSCACLDPAFGGDRCIIRRFDYGLDKEGKMRILFHAPVLISINPVLKDERGRPVPAEYQISEKTEEFCRSNRIQPENFILDATGTGRGAAAVLQREWSPSIHVCEFGGDASGLTVSDENPIPARDEYDRRVTELYFAFREFVQADMIRGLDVEAASEFCHRTFFIKGTGKGKRTAIQSKSELKAEGRPSPDLSDNAVLAVELLRRRGINASVVTEVKQNAADKFEEKVKELDWDAREDVYSDGLDEFAYEAYEKDQTFTPYDADWN